MQAVDSISKPVVSESVFSRLFPTSWAYAEADTARDLRIDFMRGWVMFILVIIHVDVFSVYNFIVWERIGVVSGGEGFVILSGLILGIVNRHKINKSGLTGVIDSTINRGLQIYRVNLLLLVVVFLVALIPFLDASSITTFTDHGSGKTYQLFPSAEAPLKEIAYRFLLLKNGSQQTQVLGLYVVLLLLSPLAFFAFSRGRAVEFLALCWILYVVNWAHPSRPTGAQFEYAFPVLSWQLTFFHAMAFGYYRKEISAWFQGSRLTLVYIASTVLFAAFVFFAWNNPNPALPGWYKLDFIPSQQFYAIYSEYFRKNTLGILRIVNYLVVLIVLYKVLTVCWKPLNRLFGWWCIPVGQASLYVFILHLGLCLVVDNVQYFNELKPHYGSGNILLTTLAHSFVLLALWIMVVNKFAFRWIPR